MEHNVPPTPDMVIPAEPQAAPESATSTTPAEVLAFPIAAATEEAAVEEPAPPIDELVGLSATVRSLVEEILAPAFDGHLEVGTCGGETFRLQFGFLALEAVAERFGSYEEMGERIQKASEKGGANETFMVMLDAAATLLKGATLRHHPALTEDELDDLFSLLGDASSVVFLANVVLNWWRNHDTLGPYVAGIDPEVTLGDRTYKLRFALRAVRHVQQLMKDDDFGTLQAKHYREVLRAQLLRFHGAEFAPGMETASAVLDDLGWKLGLGGLRRLMAGAEQPKKPADDVTGASDPNAQAGQESPAESGTGRPS